MSHSGIFYLPVAIIVLIVEEFKVIKNYISETSEKISYFRYPASDTDYGYKSLNIDDIFSSKMVDQNSKPDFLLAIPIKPIEKEKAPAFILTEDDDHQIEINEKKLSLRQNAVIHRIRSIAKKNGLRVDKTYMNLAGEAVVEMSLVLPPAHFVEFEDLFEAPEGEISCVE